MNYNLPNTRERIAARRRALQANRHARNGSYVRPGPRRVLGEWVVTGKLVSLILFFATLGMFGYLFTAKRFTVQHVTVTGNDILNADSILDLAQAQGLSIWFFDDAPIAQRLLQNAYIEQAHFRVTLSGQAVISIIERRPEVRWQLGGVQYLVDSHGKVLGMADTQAIDEPPTNTILPFLVIVDSSRHVLKPNDQVDPDALKLAQILELRLPTELKFKPRIIGWDFALGVYIKTNAGQTVVFGQTENLDRKLAILAHLIKDQTEFTYLDLRPSNPYYQNTGEAPKTP